MLVDLYIETFGYITDGYFVDIGAFDCIQWSNTHILAQAGWSGIMVEPQPEMAEECMEHLRSYPKVALVQKAISNWRGKTSMRLAGSLSTIDMDQVELYRETPEFAHYFDGDGEHTLVDVIDTDTLLFAFATPIGFEIMSIDVEGSEMAVLDGFSIDKYKPQLVIVEAHEKWHDNMLPNATKINDYFDRAGYKKVYSDHINNIYRPKNA